MLNESASVKNIDIVDHFIDISKRITTFDTSLQIEDHLYDLLTLNNENGDEDNE